VQLVAHGPLEPRILVRVQAPEPLIPQVWIRGCAGLSSFSISLAKLLLPVPRDWVKSTHLCGNDSDQTSRFIQPTFEASQNMRDKLPDT
jgi:hypothetical protein